MGHRPRLQIMAETPPSRQSSPSSLVAGNAQADDHEVLGTPVAKTASIMKSGSERKKSPRKLSRRMSEKNKPQTVVINLNNNVCDLNGVPPFVYATCILY